MQDTPSPIAQSLLERYAGSRRILSVNQFPAGTTKIALIEFYARPAVP
jgi:hypothetical protein